MQSLENVDDATAVILVAIFILSVVVTLVGRKLSALGKTNTELQNQVNFMTQVGSKVKEALPDDWEAIADIGKGLGDYAYEYLVSKGGTLTATVALRHPAVQSSIKLLLSALMHYCNHHGGEALEVLDIENKPIKIKLGDI